MPRGRKSWATPEQASWLREKLDLFIDHQKAQKTHTFWPKMEREWFERFPIESHTVTPESGSDAESDSEPSKPACDVKLQKKFDAPKTPWQRLKAWFNNNAQKTQKQSGSARFMENFLDEEVRDKGTRAPHPAELWSKTDSNYELKVKHRVDAELASSSVDPRKAVAIVKRNICAAFAEEPDHVKDKMIEMASALKKTADDVEESDDDTTDLAQDSGNEDEDITSAEDMSRFIHALPGVLMKFCKAVKRRTGFNVSVVCGGPDPSSGGKVQTMAAHEGTNQLGHSFAQAHVGYQEHWLRPYVAFAKSCFNPPSGQSSGQPVASSTTTTESPVSVSSSAVVPGAASAPAIQTVSRSHVAVITDNRYQINPQPVPPPPPPPAIQASSQSHVSIITDNQIDPRLPPPPSAPAPSICASNQSHVSIITDNQIDPRLLPPPLPPLAIDPQLLPPPPAPAIQASSQSHVSIITNNQIDPRLLPPLPPHPAIQASSQSHVSIITNNQIDPRLLPPPLTSTGPLGPLDTSNDRSAGSPDQSGLPPSREASHAPVDGSNPIPSPSGGDLRISDKSTYFFPPNLFLPSATAASRSTSPEIFDSVVQKDYDAFRPRSLLPASRSVSPDMAESVALLCKKPQPRSEPSPTVPDTSIAAPPPKKVAKRATRPTNDDDLILHSKRARRPPATKDIQTLTTDETGRKAINDASGKPLDKKKEGKRSQKENKRLMTSFIGHRALKLVA
ncbi:hypothetical protein H0H93_013166 [Arthromyces matolae]|nr:hypothetical protein H0H93_013166 [Arthromyces matolae]